MSYYGNNLGALTTGGTLVYIDEPASVDIAETPFDSVLISGRDVFLNNFAVDGIYQPGILNRAIKGIPKYVQDDATIDPVIRHRSPVLHVTVPNDPSNGIAAEEFEMGQSIVISPRKGADSRAFNLVRIVKQNAAFVTYECH